MTEDEFENSLDATFKVGYDPVKGQNIEYKFAKKDFIELKNSPDNEDPTHLYKLAARDCILKLEAFGLNFKTEQ